MPLDFSKVHYCHAKFIQHELPTLISCLCWTSGRHIPYIKYISGNKIGLSELCKLWYRQLVQDKNTLKNVWSHTHIYVATERSNSTGIMDFNMYFPCMDCSGLLLQPRNGGLDRPGLSSTCCCLQLNPLGRQEADLELGWETALYHPSPTLCGCHFTRASQTIRGSHPAAESTNMMCTECLHFQKWFKAVEFLDTWAFVCVSDGGVNTKAIYIYIKLYIKGLLFPHCLATKVSYTVSWITLHHPIVMDAWGTCWP